MVLSVGDLTGVGLEVYSANVAYKSREKVFTKEDLNEALGNIPDGHKLLFIKENKGPISEGV